MTSLTTAALDQRLNALLNPVLSTRRTALPLAQALTALTRAQQDFTLHWVEIIGRTNYEMAYQFAAAAPAALPALDAATAEAWIIHAMDSYDRAGLYQGTESFKNCSAYALQANEQHAVAFAEAAPVLELFICGLAGRRLTLAPTNAEANTAAWTDTDTLYLPPRMAASASCAENFLRYKIIATLLWAQTRYGTFSVNLEIVAHAHADPERALAWLNFFETLRLQARIARALPGLARDMYHVATPTPRGSEDSRYSSLLAQTATVKDSIALLHQLDITTEPPRSPWHSVLRPADATTAREARLAKEKNDLQALLAALLEEEARSSAGNQDGDSTGEGKGDSRFDAEVTTDADGEIEIELRLDGKAIAPPDHVRNLLDAIAQDLGEVPDDWLKPHDGAADARSDDDIAALLPEDHPVYYHEWDYQRRHYRKDWCALRELDVPDGEPDFVATTLAKYAPQVVQLKRSFEMLRGEDRLLKRMTHGDDIDLDAVIAGYADMRSGMELTERLFTKRHKAERNLAVMFMVDMSGSTKGWINEAEREALVLLAEALEVLGDRYAIYGFSGMTRKRCEIFRIKRFDEPYTAQVRNRIAGIAPQDYTRMGTAIRHLSTLLEGVDARTKLLITLSDGKPDDYSDNYRGEYGIEDTRQALLEAHRAGIRPFCITIDHEARDYLPHMYGAVNWTLVDDVARLPFKVTDIYRRLTT